MLYESFGFLFLFWFVKKRRNLMINSWHLNVLKRHKTIPCSSEKKKSEFYSWYKYILFIYLFTYLLIFLAALGLRCCVQAFSCCRARAPGVWASVVVARGLPEQRLTRCGTQAYLLCDMWDPPGPGIEPMSPALAGGFSTTAPPGKFLMI